MTELRDRFRTLDALRAPSLWTEVEVRSVTARRGAGGFGLALLVAAALGLALVGGVVLVGSGRSPATSQPSPPSPTPSPVRPGPGWAVTSHLLESRNGHTATLLPNGGVLVAGGLSQAFGVGRASAELYDPSTGAWSATGSMRDGRAGHTATVLRDGTVLVVGGVAANNEQGTDPEVASAEIYDPASGTWTPVAAPSAGEGLGALLLPDGRVLVTGGYDERARRPVGSAELYDPASRTWSDVANPRFPASAGATLLLDGRVLAVLVETASRRQHTAFFEPATRAWTPGPDLPERFGGAVSVRLGDGRILAAGGSDPNGSGANGAAASALYDPATASWRMTGSMVVARLGHTATLLPDGRVLVVGGKVFGAAESPRFSSAELYDPATGAWAAIGDTGVARDGHTATLLPDGRVLVAGGEAQGGGALDAAELFQP